MDITFAIALIAFLGIAAHWLAWRFHWPAIVSLLLAGFLVGPVFGFLDPDAIFGDMVRPVVSIAVAVILFEGGLNLNVHELRETQQSVRRLIFIGAPLAWFLISLSAFFVAGLSLPVSITFGGILVVTGPTVIMPLLRQARLKQRTGSLLKWEGIVNDPIGALFAVLAFEFFTVTQDNALSIGGFAINFALVLLVIGTVSLVLARIMAWILEHGHMPEFLKTPFILTTVIMTYFLANALQKEGGLLAVTILGMALANLRISSIEDIRRFKESITVMLVAGVFIILTANLDLDTMLSMNIQSISFILVLLLVIRPLTVFLSTIGTSMTWQEKILVGWIAPRGVVCIAVAGLFGPSMVEAGYEDAEIMVPLAFGVVMTTVLAHGFSLRCIGRKLSLVEERANGLIIVGGYSWTIQLAEVLKNQNIPIMIADRNWLHLKPARFLDIPVYYGEMLSEDTDFNLEFNPYGSFLAATDNTPYNALLCNKFTHEFGRDNVYQLSVPEDENKSHRSIAHTLRGRRFIHSQIGVEDLIDMFRDGWRFKCTTLSEDFDYQAFIQNNPEDMIIVGNINERGILRFKKPESELKPKNGDILISFQPDNSKT